MIIFFCFIFSIFLISSVFVYYDYDFITSISAAVTSVSVVGPGLGNIIGPEESFTQLPSALKLLLSFGMVLGRLGKGSTMILTGDPQQIDLKFPNDSAIHEVPKVKDSSFVYATILTDNHRHEALDELLKLLQNYS